MKKNNYLSKKNMFKIFCIMIIFTVFLSTQFLLPIKFMEKIVYVYRVEIILIILFFIAAIDILVRKKKIVIGKKEIIYLFILIVWFLLLTFYRHFVYGDITGGLIIFRVLMFPILFILLLRQYNIDKKNICTGFLLFISYINICQVYDLIVNSNSFRTSLALKNINIYLCFMISIIPLLLILSNNKFIEYKNKKLINVVIILNFIIISVFSILSGSRIGILFFTLMFVLSYLLIFKITINSLIKFAISILVLILLIFTLVQFKIYDGRENLLRAIDPVIQILKNTSIDKPSKNNEIKLETSDNEVNNETATENINENKPNVETNNGEIDNKDKFNNNNEVSNNSITQNSSVVDSNNMRSLLWKKSIEYIKKNPIFGKGNIDIEIDMYFSTTTQPTKIIQSPHNFILEIWLALGLPGMISYFILLIYNIIKIFVSKTKFNIKMNFMLSFISILFFSFFQPLMTSYFAISIILWILIYLYLEEV